MASLQRLSLRRAAAGIVACVWLAVGLFGAFHYVHAYAIYRGFPVPKTPPGIAQGQLKTVAFHSPAIGRTSHYLVYLPPGYAQAAAHGKRYPVMYLLHGYPGKMPVFVNVGAIGVTTNVGIAQQRIPPMIIVMPGGKSGVLGADTEWANTPSGNWMSYVTDVVHDVDRHFATIPNRQHRGIAGDSEGAYGAVNIALHELGLFSVLESWGGYFTQTPTGVFKGATPAVLAANSPASYVTSLAPRIRKLGLRAWLYQGRTDPSDPALVRNFSLALHRAGADVRLGFYPGGHDWALFRAQTPHMLAVAGYWFGQRPGGRAYFAHSGHALSKAAIRGIVARRRARCLARPAGAHVKGWCRRYRRAHAASSRARHRATARSAARSVSA
jgi:enterochelin esterase-like enzyme